MLKTGKRILCLLTLITAIVLFIVPLPGKATQNDIIMSLVPKEAGKLEYYSGELITTSLVFDLRQVVGNFNDSKLVITVPDTYMESVSASLIDLGQQSVTSSGGLTTITYDMGLLVGGAYAEIPILTTLKWGFTPDHYTFPITASFYDAAGNLLKSATPLTYTNLVLAPSVITSVWSGTYNHVTPDYLSFFAGLEDPNNPGFVSPTATSAIVISYVLHYPGPIPAGAGGIIGTRIFDKEVFTVTLPNGAVFDQAVNPGWTYNSADNTATYTADTTNYLYSVGANGSFTNDAGRLFLTFPGQSLSDLYTAQGKLEFIPLDGQTYEDTTKYISFDDISFYLNADLPLPWMEKGAPDTPTVYDQLASKEKPVEWRIIMRNGSTDLNMENIYVLDNGLDPRLEFSYVWLAIDRLVGLMKVEAIDGNGVVTTVRTGVLPRDYAKIPLPAGTRSVRVSSNTGSYLPPGPNQEIFFFFGSVFTDPAGTHPEDVLPNDTLKNSFDYGGTYPALGGVGFDETFPEIRVYKPDFLPYDPMMEVVKSSDKQTVLVKDQMNWTIFVQEPYQNRLFDPDTLENPVLVDLLPQGLTYVPGSAKVNNYVGGSITPMANPEPTVVENYRGSGRTALIWTWTTPYRGSNNTNQFQMITAIINFSTIATRDLATGTNTNDTYMIWDNNGTGDPALSQQVLPGKPVPDALDIDQDGNLTEDVAHTTSTFVFEPPLELMHSKYVKGELDSGFVQTGGRAEIGGTAIYELRVLNNTPTNASPLVLVDALPMLNDKTLSLDENNLQQPRGSEFNLTLDGPVTGPAGYTVYYTQDVPTGTANEYADNAAWTVGGASFDYSLVRGIKIVMDQGNVLESNARVTFSFPVRLPSDMSLLSGDRAVNSFSRSMNGVDYVPSTLSSVQIVRYQVTGTAFFDANKDGIWANTAAEMPLSGITVSLLDENGQPALDLSGQPITAVTGNDGSYTLDVFRQGNYQVSFARHGAYTFTIPGDLNDSMASHVLTNDAVQNGLSDLFTLSPAYTGRVRNAGYYNAMDNILVRKELRDSKGLVLTGERAFRYSLTLGGEPYTGLAILNNTPMMVADGSVTIKNTDTFWLYLPTGQPFTITETGDLSAYEVNPASASYAFDTAQGIRELLFVNTEKPIGTLSVSLEVLDENGAILSAPLSFPVTLQLPGGGTQSIDLTNQNPSTLQSLDFGTYSLVMPIGPDGYSATYSGPVTLSVQQINGVIKVTLKRLPPPVEPTDPPQYDRISVPVTARKTLQNGTLKAGQFTFVLKDAAGKELARAQNLANGSVVFPDRTFSRMVSNYLYTISEVTGNETGVTYDSTVYTFSVTTKAEGGQLIPTVSLKKDGVPFDGEMVFRNTRKAPATGDRNIDTIALLTLAALSTFFGYVLLQRRRKGQT